MLKGISALARVHSSMRPSLSAVLLLAAVAKCVEINFPDTVEFISLGAVGAWTFAEWVFFITSCFFCLLVLCVVVLTYMAVRVYMRPAVELRLVHWAGRDHWAVRAKGG